MFPFVGILSCCGDVESEVFLMGVLGTRILSHAQYGSAALGLGVGIGQFVPLPRPDRIYPFPWWRLIEAGGGEVLCGLKPVSRVPIPTTTTLELSPWPVVIVFI